MKVTVRAPVVLTFTSATARAVAFLALSVLRATVISTFVYVAFTTWLGRLLLLGKAILRLAQLLHVPIFLFSHSVGRVLPHLCSPFRLDGVIDSRAGFADHTRAGVASYTLLFFVPTLFRFVRERAAGRNAQGVA